MRLLAALAACLLTLALPTAAWAQATPSQPREEVPPARQGFFDEPSGLTKAVNLVGRRMAGGDGRSKSGFYFDMGSMITGAGWISVGSGYRYHFWGDRATVDAAAAMSWRLYKTARLRFELPRLADGRVTAGTELRWQDALQITYFGAGADAPEADRSQYRMRSTTLAGYLAAHPRPWLSLEGRAGRIFSPSLGPPTGAFIRDEPFTRTRFPLDPVFARDDQPDFLLGELSATADTRDRPGHPLRGGLYRAAWTSYSDRAGGAFSFRQLQSEAVHFVPVAADRVVFAARGWLVASDTAPGKTIPFYLLPSLGGNNTMRGYTDYRFHDRNLLLFTAEARVALFTHLDLAAFLDAGNVAARFGDLDLGKQTYGAGLRLHTEGSTFARLEAATGDEGWQVLFRVNDPLRLSRLTKRAVTVPFVP